MSEISITKGRSHVSFPQLPDMPVDPSPLPLAPLDMVLQFSEGRQLSVHLANVPCSTLVHELLMALVDLCSFGGIVNSPGAAEVYTSAIRKFVRFLSTRHSAQACPPLSVSDLAPQDLDGFEEQMRAQAIHEESVSSYRRIGSLIRLLRWWQETHPERLSAMLTARLAYVANGPVGRSTPRDGYSEKITDALRTACLKDISQIVERHTAQCDQQLATGRDPEIYGWEDTQNVVWYIVHNGIIPTRSVKNKRWYQVSDGLEKVHTQIFPTTRDLVPFLVLLALSTDIAIESLKDLRTDCLQNPTNGTVEIHYLKRRAHSQEWKTERVRDGGMTTPGGIIRLVLRLTQHARAHFTTTHLWIAFRQGRLYLPNFHSPSRGPIQRFVADYELLDEQRRPLALQLLRLRKTRRAERYVLGHGQLEDVARGVHTPRVAGDHYADIPALRHIHEATIAQALEEALQQAVAHILPPAEEQQLRENPKSAPVSLSVEPEQIEALLAGEQDVWVAGCANFYASPFGKPGLACPVPVWGCLECPNAVITSRHLPTILSFLNRMLAERERLEEQTWAAQFSRPYARIVQQILPAFPSEVVLSARAMLESTTEVAALPPNLALLRHTS